MRAAILSDIHSRAKMIEAAGSELRGCDVVLISGDITNFGNYEDARRVLGAVEKANGRILAVAGNCDNNGVEEYLCERGYNLGGEVKEFDGFYFCGLSGFEPKDCRERGIGLEVYFDEQLGRLRGEIAGRRPFIFVSHHPAFNTEVDLDGGRHRGSGAVFDFIVDTQPVLAVSGHIHNADRTDLLGDCTLVNPGPMKNGCIAIVEIDGKGVRVERKLV